ncbi:MAG: hypothetical protein JNN30_12150 [Rhodanobacteraceae bacterium]|nr:hypothetical protein [Rhodanobacteraceae bacterium]
MTVEPGDVGPVYQFQKARSHFTIVNDTDSELRGVVVKALRPTDRVLTAPASVAARGNAVVDVEIDSQSGLGARGHSFQIEYEGAKTPALARISFYGLSVVNNPQRVLDFETVKAGESPAIPYRLETDDPQLRIAAVKEAPDFVDAMIDKDGRGLVVRHRDKSTWGKLSGVLKIQLESAVQKEAWIPVQSEVRGDVMPSTTNFSLGVARIGQENEYILQYRSEGKPFTLDKAVLERIAGTTKIENCVGDEKYCQQVRLLIDGNQPSGQLNGSLRVRVVEYDRDIVVPTGGLLVTKEVKIKSLDEELAKSAKAGLANKPQPSLNGALKSMSAAEKPVEAVVPPGNGPLLRWAVDNEELIYGYGIYRADSERGEYARQGEIVRRSAVFKPGVTSKYAIRDTQATVGKEYWYRIAAFYADGKREFLTAPQRVKVRPPETDAATR